MSIWDELLEESKKLEEAAREIQPVRIATDDTAKNANLYQKKINDVISSYQSWYSACLSRLPDDLKPKFRISYEGDGYAEPCITKFFQDPLARKKTYPNGRRGKAISTWQYPFQKYF